MLQDRISGQKPVNLTRTHLLKIFFVFFFLSGLLASPQLFAEEGPGQNLL